LYRVAETLFTDAERTALAGFLAGYSGLTRDAYTLDLRQYTCWCTQRGLHLFTAGRADIECFGRDMESHGRARATIARRLCTVAGFYRYAVEEDLLEHSPAAHVRRPRLDYESHAVGAGSQRSRRAAGRRRSADRTGGLLQMPPDRRPTAPSIPSNLTLGGGYSDRLLWRAYPAAPGGRAAATQPRSQNLVLSACPLGAVALCTSELLE
jgi:hypothetical protein